MWEYTLSPNPDELYHWKYTRKYKNSKGNWVYIYPNDKHGIKNFVDTKITGKAYRQHNEEATKEAIRAYADLSNDHKDIREGAAAKARYDDATKQMNSTEEDFYTKSVIGRGKVAVDSILNRMITKKSKVVSTKVVSRKAVR